MKFHAVSSLLVLLLQQQGALAIDPDASVSPDGSFG
jgi:hypothetical protein